MRGPVTDKALPCGISRGFVEAPFVGYNVVHGVCGVRVLTEVKPNASK